MTSSTEETRAVVERMYEAGRTSDAEVFGSCFGSDIEIEEPAWLPYGGVFRGTDGMAKLFADVATLVDYSTIRLETVLADGDDAVAFLRSNLHSGAEIYNVERWKISDGKITRGTIFFQDPTPVHDMLAGTSSSSDVRS